MPTRIGLDVGSASVKLVAFMGPKDVEGLAASVTGSSAFRLVAESLEQSNGRSLGSIIVSEYRRSFGNPYQAAIKLLNEFQAMLPDSCRAEVRVTGSGGHRVAEALNVPSENEFKAIARGVSAMCPQIRTVFEMGGENSKYLLLNRSGNSDGGVGAELHICSAGILDYSMSSQCAAGTGSFIDQQASRLQYRVEDIGAIV
jgi:activator of 2-hydroxyglutaryl-CoA dehydratase